MEKLPKKWFIENPRNKNSPKIYDYFNKGCGSKSYSDGTHFHYPNWGDGNGFKKGYHTSTPKERYTEITFEQFEKWVLNPKPEEPQYEIY